MAAKWHFPITKAMLKKIDKDYQNSPEYFYCKE